MGQGDPWVLMAADLYVSCQFKRLHKIAPAVRTSAVIDDRTLRGPPDQVQRALQDVVRFDEKAGHVTNPEKITLSATTKKVKNKITGWVFGEIKPPVVDSEKLVEMSPLSRMGLRSWRTRGCSTPFARLLELRRSNVAKPPRLVPSGASRFPECFHSHCGPSRWTLI